MLEDSDDTETLREKIDAIDALAYDELLRDAMVDTLDERTAARALFDKGVEYLELAVSPLPVPKLADLVAAFDLEAAHGIDPAPIIFPSLDAGIAGAPGGAGDAPADPNLPGLGGFGAATARVTDTMNVPKDTVHVSDRATIFRDWHIKSFPSGPYQSPFSVPIEDEGIIANIKKARRMLPVIPHGTPGVAQRQYAGTMQWTPFTTTLAGWMYVEPRGDYQDYFWGRVHQMYDDAVAEADKVVADPTATAAAKMGARARQRNISAGAAVCRQEGLPPAINTYDGTVLTWCSGLAAPGLLNRIFNAIAKDPVCAKVMYLCGFLFQGNAVWGEFQIADVESEVPAVYHRGSTLTEDLVNPDTGKTTTPRGGIDYGAYKVLSVLTDQIELIYMLIALARDELTRDKVFDPNFEVMAGMVDVAGAENLNCEALYVFIGEVQHNWSLNSRPIFTAAIRDKTHRPSNLVQWAIDHFTDDERQLTLPSPEGDRAIAKGIFRFTLRSIQEDAFNTAKTRLAVTCRAKKTKMVADNDRIRLSSVVTMYGFQRLMDAYWTPMQTGVGPAKVTPHSIDGSTLDVPDFPVKLANKAAASPGDQVVQDKPISDATADATFYAIGTEAQADFLFPKDVDLLGFDDAGNVKVQDTVTGMQWAMQQDRLTRVWSRVP